MDKEQLKAAYEALADALAQLGALAYCYEDDVADHIDDRNWYGKARDMANDISNAAWCAQEIAEALGKE